MQEEVKIVHKEQAWLTTFDEIEDLNHTEYEGCYPEGYYDSPRNNYLKQNFDQNFKLFEENDALEFKDLYYLYDVYGKAFALIPSDKNILDMD